MCSSACHFPRYCLIGTRCQGCATFVWRLSCHLKECEAPARISLLMLGYGTRMHCSLVIRLFVTTDHKGHIQAKQHYQRSMRPLFWMCLYALQLLNEQPRSGKPALSTAEFLERCSDSSWHFVRRKKQRPENSLLRMRSWEQRCFSIACWVDKWNALDDPCWCNSLRCMPA